MNFTKSTPQVVAITKERSPSRKIFMDLALRNTSACVEAPTVRPMSVVAMSMMGPRAFSARRLVTPLSFSRLPKKSIPRSGRPEGTMNAVQRKPMMGNIIFSRCDTLRGGAMRMRRSFLVVSSSIMGFCMTGTRAMYE